MNVAELLEPLAVFVESWPSHITLVGGLREKISRFKIG